MLRTLFFHLSDAHSLSNRIELSEPRDDSRAPQHVKRRHLFPTRLHPLCLVLLRVRPFGEGSFTTEKRAQK